jgi:CheY-like chemotaxis protein
MTSVPASTPATSGPQGRNEDKFNVLVVDDEQQICDLVSIFLGKTGYFNPIITANNAINAAQKMQNQEFDLVVVDFSMPNKTGIEFIAHLRQIYRYANLQIILISGCLQKSDVLTAVNYEVNDILVKPFTRGQLVNKVFQMLRISP